MENFRAERNRAFDKAFAAQRLSDYETRLTAPTTTIHDYVKMVKSRVLLGGPVVIAPAPSQAEEDQYLKQFAAESNAKNARATAEAVAEVRAANAEVKAAEMRVKITAKLIRDNEKESKRQQKAKSAAAAAASKAADAAARAARAKLRAEVAADGAAPADAAAPTTASSEDGSTTRVPKRQKKSAATPLPAPPVGCGLVNKGSTCYANAVLQCLTHTPPLCEKLLAREHSNDCARKDNSACWLCWLESHVRNAFLAKTPISPQMGGASIVNAGPGFRTGKQEDAHEYLRHLLDELQQAAKLNSVRNQGGRTGQDEDHFPFSLFQGKLISSIKCAKCGTSSPTVDVFEDVTLGITNAGSVRQALKNFTKKERLEGDNAYYCDKCQTKVRASKQLLLRQVPPVVTLQLKRFTKATATAAATKDDKDVQFDEELDISRHLSSEDEEATPHVELKLCGVLVHTGSLAYGHYYAFVKGADGKWHRMDDQKVTAATPEQVLREKAYMLFYTHPGGGWNGASALASASDSTGVNGSPAPDGREKAEVAHVDAMATGESSAALATAPPRSSPPTPPPPLTPPTPSPPVPAPEPDNLRCEVVSGSGRCPGYPPASTMFKCKCGATIHDNCGRLLKLVQEVA